MRTSLGFALTALLAAGLAGAAQAAGGPSVREDAGLTGIATPTGFRYVAIGERNRTVLARASARTNALSPFAFWRGATRLPASPTTEPRPASPATARLSFSCGPGSLIRVRRPIF
jgi:hypothetical protein